MEELDQFLAELNDLCARYGMRLEATGVDTNLEVVEDSTLDSRPIHIDSFGYKVRACPR